MLPTNQHANFARPCVGRCLICVLVPGICVFVEPVFAQETCDPDHRDVQRLINKGMNFLERNATFNQIGNTEQRSFDNVPAFIFALTDPDERVVAAAKEALRFVSRNTTAPKIEEGKRPSRTEIDELKRFWKEWFLKVKSDGILLQEPDPDN